MEKEMNGVTRKVPPGNMRARIGPFFYRAHGAPFQQCCSLCCAPT